MSELEISRRERKKDETRQRIFLQAIRLFRHRGFEATTVDDITESADVARGTFFNYFPKKESVLAYLSEQRLMEAEAAASEVLAARKSAVEKLIAIFARAASAYEADRELSQYVLNELLQRAFAPVEDIGSRWDQMIYQVIEQGQASGELRRDLDPMRAIGVLVSSYYGVLFQWVHCPERLDFNLQDELRGRIELVLDGLTPRGGRS
jgi:AcrR family transcriptional regulator